MSWALPASPSSINSIHGKSGQGLEEVGKKGEYLTRDEALFV